MEWYGTIALPCENSLWIPHKNAQEYLCTYPIKPYRQRIPICYQKPLTNIKFRVVYQEWAFCKSTQTEIRYSEDPRIKNLQFTASAWLGSQLILNLNENALEGRRGKDWKVVKITLLIRFCQIYFKKLPERSLSSFKISKFEDLGS